jgi:hypothetical protein
LKNLVDTSIDPAKYPDLNKRAMNEATNAVAMKDMKGVNEAIQKYATVASEQEKTIATETDPGVIQARVGQAKAIAEARSPIQIYTAGAEQAAKNQQYALSPDALQMAAESYRKTGVLPSIGRNPQAQAQIINAAGAMGPLDLATEKAAYAANKASLGSLVKSRDAVTAFENTAGKNLDLFLKTAGKIVDSGVPWINAPLRTLSSAGLGSADQAAYNVARQVAVNEIAKVTGSPSMTGALSDSARHEVEAFNPQNATLAQTYRVAQILKQDMANRSQSYNDQIADISRRIGQGGTSKAPQSGTGAKTYQKTATGPNGHKIGTNDEGKTWFDVQTGQAIK